MRLFAYRFVAVVLVLYLSEIGLNDHRIGLLLSLTAAQAELDFQHFEE
ncbi:MAG TPA: hypothetical protein VGQ46_19345 [Thermoanaerobaculia bacterium]|nr:hypothetical protein [Thermoanaerobaculia bacterium]